MCLRKAMHVFIIMQQAEVHLKRLPCYIPNITMGRTSFLSLLTCLHFSQAFTCAVQFLLHVYVHFLSFTLASAARFVLHVHVQFPSFTLASAARFMLHVHVQFPSYTLASAARFVSFVVGSFTALLLLVSFGWCWCCCSSFSLVPSAFSTG